MFTRRFIASVAGTTLTAAALGLASLGLAGTAGATTSNDATFLAQLQADGITPPTAATAISDAHTVCNLLDQGTSPKQVVSEFAEASGLSTKAANTFAVDAASAYCPQYVTTT